MPENTLLSIVVPVYNEATIITRFHQRLTTVLKTLSLTTEIIYVNDGSTDNTLEVLTLLRSVDPQTAIVALSRNFGKEIALAAGLDYSQGDAVVVIDVDLQDPPELIPTLLDRWRQGYEVVFAKRISRAGETWFKKLSAHLFYRFLQRLSPISIPVDTGDFRLLSRRVVNSLKQLRERHRFMKGLFAWVGYAQIAVPYERAPRVGGESKWNYWKLWNLAIEGITSFTITPLKLATYLGFFTVLSALLYALFMLYTIFTVEKASAGYSLLMFVTLFLGGIQLIILGIIGEYLGRIFMETKQRPLYLVQTYEPANFLPSETIK